MSSVTLQHGRLAHRWHVPHLFHTWRRRRRAVQVFVALMHPADLPPGS